MADINVTPMVDVMLVLLVVFMITAPMLATGVAVNLPKTRAEQMPTDNERPLVVTVNKEGKIFVGMQDKEVEPDGLGADAAGHGERQARQARLCARRRGRELWPGHGSPDPAAGIAGSPRLACPSILTRRNVRKRESDLPVCDLAVPSR